MTAPLFTLLLIVRNGAATVEKALESVRAQSFRDFECLALDGGSTDGTVEIIEKYSDVIHLASRSDKGPYDAMHKGFAMARGTFIGLLMADDWLAPDALEVLAALHVANPQARMLTFGQQVHVPGPGGEAVKERYYLDRPGSPFTLFDGMYCQGLNRFYHRDMLGGSVFKSERYSQMADREFYMRLGLRRTPVAQVDKGVYHFLKHPASNSAGADISQKIRMFRETLGLARDYLAEEDLSPRQRQELRDWYCFILLRLCYYLFFTGNMWTAWKDILHALQRFPDRLALSCLRWKMPGPYQGKTAG